MIEVRLYATFREGREKIYEMDPDGLRTASDILNALNILKEDVAILLINGKHSKPEDAVKDGDVLAFFPPVGGG